MSMLTTFLQLVPITASGQQYMKSKPSENVIGLALSCRQCCDFRSSVFIARRYDSCRRVSVTV